MLLELSIKDFAIIDELTLPFGERFNVFTGETGAGKSIIIDAIDLVLGDRASGDLIRSNAEEATVEALFDVKDASGIGDILEAAGLPSSEELIVKRIVSRSGRNRTYINGSLATLVTLTEVTGPLIDICGQSEHQSLTKTDEHLSVLDRFGGLEERSREMARSYSLFSELRGKLAALKREVEEAAEDKELKEFQIKEIEEADLRDGEEEELASERERLRNFTRLTETSENAARLLYTEDGSAVEKMGTALRSLKEVVDIDERLGDAAKRLKEALVEAEDVAETLRDYSAGGEFDPGRLEEVEERLELISSLKRKYGATIVDILKVGEELRGEFDKIDNFSALIKDLETQLEAAEMSAVETAERLSGERRKAAEWFKGAIEGELKDLGMKGAVFEAAFGGEGGGEGAGGDAERQLTSRGYDHVTFYVSTNPGEELKPMKKIASGGELARIMLAIKKTTAGGKVPTLIFDEVDTGVGGSMAKVVGEKLKEVAAASQVFCITHLPQVAAMADSHYFVSKDKGEGERVVTAVTELREDDERVLELSRMLGGSKGKEAGETALSHARELLKAAK